MIVLTFGLHCKVVDMAPVIMDSKAKNGSKVTLDLDPFEQLLYKVNKGVTNYSPTLPLPPAIGMPLPIHDDQSITKGIVKEPIFDAKVHLQLEMPKFVRLLKGFEKAPYAPSMKDEQRKVLATFLPILHLFR